MPDARYTEQGRRTIERLVASMPFTDPMLLDDACTQSFGNHLVGRSQQQLAIIGDGIVNERIAKFLGVHWPDRTDQYHAIRGHYYSNGHMAEVMVAMGLDELLKPTDEHTAHALGSLYEALVGAMWLNDGDRGPTAFIWRTILKPIDVELRTGHRPRYVPPADDPVRALKIVTIRMYQVGVVFQPLHDHGHVDHHDRACVRLEIPERYHCDGSGETCEAAYRQAAMTALKYLKTRSETRPAIVESILGQYH